MRVVVDLRPGLILKLAGWGRATRLWFSLVYPHPPPRQVREWFVAAPFSNHWSQGVGVYCPFFIHKGDSFMPLLVRKYSSHMTSCPRYLDYFWDLKRKGSVGALIQIYFYSKDNVESFFGIVLKSRKKPYPWVSLTISSSRIPPIIVQTCQFFASPQTP